MEPVDQWQMYLALFKELQRCLGGALPGSTRKCGTVSTEFGDGQKTVYIWSVDGYLSQYRYVLYEGRILRYFE